MEKQFFTKRGWLTNYAMACGYIHQTVISTQETEWTITLTENNRELNTFDIITRSEKYGRGEWLTVEGIKEARAAYRNAVSNAVAGAKPAKRRRKDYEPATIPLYVYA